MSDISKAMQVGATGLRAQATRLRVIAENIANAQSTAEGPGDTPYRRKVVTFGQMMEQGQSAGVRVEKVAHDDSDFVRRYDPGHPSADDDGYVLMPNVSTLIETMDMREAQRTYEANLRVIELSRTMLMRTIELLRG